MHFWLGFRLVNASEQAEANAWIARLERLVRPPLTTSLARARLDYLTGLRAAFDGDLGTAAEDLERAAAIATRHRRRGAGCAGQAGAGSGTDLPRRHQDRCPAARRRDARRRVRADLPHRRRRQLLHRDRRLPRPVRRAPRAGVDATGSRDGAASSPTWCRSPACARSTVPSSCSSRAPGSEAMAQAGLARERLARPFRQLAYGAAAYQQGELHRLLGEFDKAEACYREASAAGRDPQPGLALLRLRQGRADDAAQAIDRAMSEAGDPVGQVPAARGLRRDHARRGPRGRGDDSGLGARRRRERARVPHARRCGPSRRRSGPAGRGRRARARWPTCAGRVTASGSSSAPYEVACTAC